MICVRVDEVPVLQTKTNICILIRNYRLSLEGKKVLNFNDKTNKFKTNLYQATFSQFKCTDALL